MSNSNHLDEGPRRFFLGFVGGIILLLFASEASAYIGPGLSVGVIGVVLGILGSIVLAIFGLFWYPIKRFMARRKARMEKETSSSRQERASDENSTPADHASKPGS